MSSYVDAITGYMGIGTNTPITNLDVNGSVSTANPVAFKNRVVNGTFAVDTRGSSGASSSASVDVIDGYTIATGADSGTLCTQKVTLSATDQVTTGGTFQNAVALSPSPLDGLVAYFPFNSNITDASGNGVSLTSNGTMQYVPGRVGNQALYLANEANVTAGTAAPNFIKNSTLSLSGLLNFSVSMWICPTKLVASSMVFFSTNSGTSALTNAIGFYISSSYKLTSDFYGISSVVGTTTLTVNTWYNVILTYNNSTTTIYLNGIREGTNTGTIASSTGFTLGTNFPSYTGPFAGFIDDFRIYNRILTVSEITALANTLPISASPATTLASGLTTRLTFDNTTADAQGTLGAPTGTPIYSTLSKFGTRSLDCTGTVIGTSESSSLIYSGVSVSLPFTMAFWFNSTTPSSATSGQVIACIGSTSTWGFETYVYNGNLGNDAYISGANYNIPTSSPLISISANTWYHVCTTITSAGYHIMYLNGVQVYSKSIGTATSLTASGGAAITTLKIGGQLGNVTSSFKGLIDDVRIYNRALSPQEVAGLYYSYQPASYVLFQQTIDAQNVADLAWGTAVAQPATISCWLKNNTTTEQQFALSVANSGSAAVTAITFESSTGIDDTLGFLTNATGTNVAYSTSVYKVGLRALDLTANTAGSSTPSTYINYNLSNKLSLPLSFSCWIYPSVVGVNYQVPLSFGNDTNESFSITIGNGGLWVQTNGASEGNAASFSTSASPFALSALTWYHIGVIYQSSSVTLYINGISVASASGVLNLISFPINRVRIGTNSKTLTYGNAFKGYIDDVRIYNRALSSSEVFNLYAANATSTTVSPYLLPRSIVYNTPNIPAGAWQKVSFTVPAETTAGAWARNAEPGIVLALCLGAGSLYTAPASQTWNSIEYLTNTGVQVFGGSSNNFLAAPTNQILLTGLQLEKGASTTSYDVRPQRIEYTMCPNTICQIVHNEYTAGGSHISTTSTSFVDGGESVRIIPRFSKNAIKVQFHSNMTQGLPSGALYVDLLRSINGGPFTSLLSSRPYRWTYRDSSWSDMTLIYKDTPNTTDQITYKVQYKTTSSTVYLVHANMGYSWTLTEISQ